jgi:hypothetical protein
LRSRAIAGRLPARPEPNPTRREVQAVWPECYPTADKRALQAAERLGLGKDPKSLAELVDRRRFPHLVDGLVRINLDKAYTKVA